MMALSMNQTEKDMRGAAGHLVPIEGVVGECVGAVGFGLAAPRRVGRGGQPARQRPS